MGWCSYLGKRFGLYYQIPCAGQGGLIRMSLAGVNAGLDRQHQIMLCAGVANQVRLMDYSMRKKQLRACMAFAWALLGAVGGLCAQPAAEPQSLGASGLALPRFASLKSDRVNLRQG